MSTTTGLIGTKEKKIYLIIKINYFYFICIDLSAQIFADAGLTLK